MNQEIPRRIRIDLFTPEEKALYEMVGKIEELGAHPLLTDCVVLLGEARSKLSDWVDLQEAEAKSVAFAGVIKMVGNSTNEAAEQSVEPTVPGLGKTLTELGIDKDEIPF